MEAIPRITVEEARQKVLAGESLFVCAYDDDVRFNRLRLDGAISLKEFQSHLAELPKNKEIIFYCAWPTEATSARVAASYIEKGYNAKALLGGVDAWQKAGYPINPPE